MQDIFEHAVLCRKCGKVMQKAGVIRNGFHLRALVCPQGHDKLIHPADEQEYRKFKELSQKEFKVKMRIVGNSYAVSIPKEIVSFMQEQEKLMNDMVRLCFEESGKLSLTFDKLINPKQKEEENE
ncbi:hypothetical protein J4411_01270 [Candidatus Pacearchaeota archaeon]|nr:hypothetical protein [uncultured archaeon]MBS3084524.1 hypothetical protein [Candidatus Pacearchaeota archaeon]